MPPHVFWCTCALQLQVKRILIFSIMDYLYLEIETNIGIPGKVIRPPRGRAKGMKKPLGILSDALRGRLARVPSGFQRTGSSNSCITIATY